ncbi:MAG TPA: hypothetical protein VH120_17625 [Gemmataceae bacterium]|nr:hypothetical protein [Gemmataceae bacterium]
MNRQALSFGGLILLAGAAVLTTPSLTRAQHGGPQSAGQDPTFDSSAAPRLEPGMRVDVVMKNAGTYYTGTLVGIDATTVRLQTIPLPGARPSEFDLSKVQAFHTNAGVYAYDSGTGRMVPAMTYYRLDQSAGAFEKMSSRSDGAFLGVRARILGPTNSAWASFAVGPDGAWVVGLPATASDSPQTIPAGNLREVVTSGGVYTYDAQSKDYGYQSHAQIADAARATRDAAGQAYYQQEWDRTLQMRLLQSNGLQAMQGNDK